MPPKRYDGAVADTVVGDVDTGAGAAAAGVAGITVGIVAVAGAADIGAVVTGERNKKAPHSRGFSSPMKSNQ